ncbi:MAG: thermonuclease family protein [Thioalkalispiraceae bacterium]|jgi:endonuclease YncB( thermonuclease family)
MSVWLRTLKKAPLTGAFFFVAILSAQAANDCSTDAYDEVVTLAKVYDGDTIKLTDGRKVRFIAVNSPEMGHLERPEQAYAQEAKATIQHLLAKSPVLRLKFGKVKKDRYKRILAHVFTEDGQNLAATLIRRGLGFAIVVPPNTWNVDCYFSLEAEAKTEGKGIWGHASYEPKSPDELSRQDTGFRIVEGVVSKVGESRKSIWLDMGNHFSVRINRKNLVYFAGSSILQLKGRRIRVRGWIAYYNHKLRMTVNHPAMLKTLDE